MMPQQKLFGSTVTPVFQWLITVLLVLGYWVLTTIDAAALPTIHPTLTPTQAIPVIQHGASQEFPAVDGQRVVWQDARSGPTDIFLLDLASGEPVNVTSSPTWEVQPAIDENWIVWKDGYAGIGIHGIDLTTNRVFTVTTGHDDTSRPRLSGNLVVWADNRAGDGDWNIYGYDLAQRAEFVITAAPGNQFDPQIDGPLVVWWDDQEQIYLYNLTTNQQQTLWPTRGARLPDVSAADQLVVWQVMRDGQWELAGYDLRQQAPIDLLTAPRDQVNAVIDQGVVVFQSKTEGGAWNVHLLDLASRQQFPLDAHSASQIQPAVSGRQVIWQDGRRHNADIFTLAWDGVIPPIAPATVAAPAHLQVGALPAGAILLQWQDQADNEAGFLLERAQGITGTQWVEILQLPANTTAYVDRPQVLEESYWYRVRAYRGSDYSTYSNESFTTTFAETPSPYEHYLMTLINAARADPAAFGYPAYAPVPPLAYQPLIAYSARSHSQAILNAAFQFGHCDLADRCPTERARAVGYEGGCAENLTTTFRTGSAAMAEANRSFLESEPHRNNMLAADLTEIGVGHTFDPAKGDRDRHGQVTEVFCGRAGVRLPALPTGAVFPPIGSTATEFTYLVNFYAADGTAPTQAQVIIDGTAYPLTLQSGQAHHGAYHYQTFLPAGEEHTFSFRFAYGDQEARWPEQGVMHSPAVLAPADLPDPEQEPPASPALLTSLFLPQVQR
ncbi:MAG: CAP domain-containing protein [Caldilineaceae bacterium]